MTKTIPQWKTAINTIPLCMYVFIVLIKYQGWNISRLLSGFASVKNIKVLLSSPIKKFVLSRNFLQFFEDFFASLTKKLPGWPGFARSKTFSRGLPGGDVPSWN